MTAKSKSKGKTADESAARTLAFEEAMEQLEDVVHKLEAGDIPLEESLEAFEKGVGLVRRLHARLDDVQKKIEELSRGARGELETAPFDEDDA